MYECSEGLIECPVIWNLIDRNAVSERSRMIKIKIFFMEVFGIGSFLIYGLFPRKPRFPAGTFLS